jgi:hypothetical protein
MRLGPEAHAPTCRNHPRRLQMTANQIAAGQAQLTGTVFGGPVSEALQQARDARHQRVREEVRQMSALAALAAEQRRREQNEHQKEEDARAPKKRRLPLRPPWEEK